MQMKFSFAIFSFFCANEIQSFIVSCGGFVLNSYRRESALSMCGVIGIRLADGKGSVATELYDALTILQHRGQDAAGIGTCNDETGRLHIHKDKGLVRDALPPQSVLSLRGNYGVGHVRYITTGDNTKEEAQPFFMTSPISFALVHNGHITNVAHLRDQLQYISHIDTNSDTDVVSHLFSQELTVLCLNEVNKLTVDLIFEAVTRVMMRCRGGYAIVIAVQGLGLVAFRDPNGIRPLCMGSRLSNSIAKFDWAFASESAALSGIGFSLKGDVKKGEAVFATVNGTLSTRTCLGTQKFAPCIFEYVYMARPDSVLDGVSVYQARAEMGRRLAKKVRDTINIEGIDVVVPVPETSRISALHLAQSLGLPYEEGLTKNRYIGRTFIMPGQSRHPGTVRKKLSPVSHILRNKRVLLVDDSIVRGTTSREIVRMVRNAGATYVCFCSAAPPVIYPNIYGIDLPSVEELIANELTNTEIAQVIGADDVVYQDLSCLKSSIQCFNPELQNFDTSIFDGFYVTAEENKIDNNNVPGSRIKGNGLRMSVDRTVPVTYCNHEHGSVEFNGHLIPCAEALIVDSE